ncbi:MAG: hypothetical protein DHS20C13_04610 [Thermodesulfobacteriota bacterium]|nr:MAG: hypothetical protein DHS20C13_04610 [Thermodesulfobacteriota bacterium]
MADMVASNISEVEILDHSNPELSRKNINITVAAFYKLIEYKDLSLFSILMSPDLKIYKNNEVWDYDLTLEYLTELNSKYDKVRFLPFEMLLVNGEYVTVKFTEKMYLLDGTMKAEKFISIFQIVNSKIQNIWELAVPTDE